MVTYVLVHPFFKKILGWSERMVESRRVTVSLREKGFHFELGSVVVRTSIESMLGIILPGVENSTSNFRPQEE